MQPLNNYGSRIVYDGVAYYNVEAKLQKEKGERESRQEWERKQKKQKGREDTDAAIIAAARVLTNR